MHDWVGEMLRRTSYKEKSLCPPLSSPKRTNPAHENSKIKIP
jgi:hypothetical protein